MQLSDTENVLPVGIAVLDGVMSREMVLYAMSHRISLDQTTAAELLPILEHFIKTGELPE